MDNHAIQGGKINKCLKSKYEWIVEFIDSMCQNNQQCFSWMKEQMNQSSIEYLIKRIVINE